jgi:DNA-binding response OmpR family regulator
VRTWHDLEANGPDDHIRLLIVDEYPQTRETAAVIYGHYGYRALVVADPDAAVEAISTFRPDAVLLEWYFRNGRVTGLSARLKQAAASESQRSLVVVALSVFDEPPEFCELETVDDYFVKPTPVEVIDRAVRALIAGTPRSSVLDG